MGIFGEVNFISRYFNKTSAKQIRGFDKLDIVKSFGIMGGYQTLVSKKAFLSYELFGGLNQYSDYSNGQPIDPILLVPIRNQLQIDARIKLGLAK